MSTISIPPGNIIMPPQAFSREPVEHILEELCAPGHDFSGFIKVSTGENVYLLFFYKSRPYAAAKSANNTRSRISLRDYFKILGTLENSKALLSIHATDPVLLKSALIFFLNSPVIKAKAAMLNLQATISQIRKESVDTLIVLQKNHHINFFFYKNSTPGSAYYSDTEFKPDTDASVEKQMQDYAMQTDQQITASIFRNTTTMEDSDAMVISQIEMLNLMQSENRQDVNENNLVLKVLSGPQKNEVLAGPIPCVLGRKDTDIIVNDALVSKRHAVLQLVNGCLLLMDLNSTNGTFVNGVRIKQHQIVLGDVIMLGETTFAIEKLSLPS